MTNIHVIADKISLNIGLITALNKMAWSITNVAPEDTAALKSVLSWVKYWNRTKYLI